MPSSSKSSPQVREFSRQQFLEIINAAETLNELTFCRKVAANWLASYPGDLEFKNIYAKILLKDGQVDIAHSVIEEVIQVDPEYLDAAITRLKVARQLTNHPQKQYKQKNYLTKTGVPDLIEWKNALQEKDNRDISIGLSYGANHWGETIQHVNKTLLNTSQTNPIPHKLDDIETVLFNLLANKPDLPIIAIAHLRILKNKLKAGKVPDQVLSSMAEHYYNLFPHCQYCCLTFIECLMQGIDTDKAVSLLHSCVSQDITGQVATRMWGAGHCYRSLWPQDLNLKLELPIPARVAGYFGWNQLDPGVAEKLGEQIPLPKKDLLEDNIKENYSSTTRELDIEKIITQNLANCLDEDEVQNKTEKVQILSDTQPVSLIQIQQSDQNNPAKEVDPICDTNDVRKELERLSIHLKQPDLMDTDGRIPTYIILTTQRGLLNVYGQQRASEIEKEVLNLVTSIRDKKSWNAVLFYPDLGVILPSGKVVAKPAQYDDPWSIKLALTDLDNVLAGFGEMIGAVLLVGGPEIIPFHHLPNPVDDADNDVPSDNPYATKDTNYFSPSWPVGRLPGGTGENGLFILQALQEYSKYHKSGLNNSINSQRDAMFRFFSWLFNAINRNNHQFNSFGYTAAAWREASYEVFRPIGEAKKMLVSPPLKATKSTKNAILLKQLYWQRSLVTKAIAGIKTKTTSLLTPGVFIPASQFSYFNLHGLVNAVEWYGQSDLLDQDSDEPDYPIALRPSDIGSKGQKAPWLVFTEACYGANIINKKLDQAMAFQFMQKGCQAYVGSTCVSYGSLNPPISAADFLGNAFWIAVRQGFSAGESLCRAKRALASEMNKKQGYLSGEDQKTLISFVLFGDPLAQRISTKPLAKSGYRKRLSTKYSHITCNHDQLPSPTKELTPEEISQIKRILNRYLPGMRDAHMTFRSEHISNCQVCRYNCGKNLSKDTTSQKETCDFNNSTGLSIPWNKVVTLCKESENLPEQHIQYARLTLNNKGKLVKLVISR